MQITVHSVLFYEKNKEKLSERIRKKSKKIKESEQKNTSEK
jgi:hypothetical protein